MSSLGTKPDTENDGDTIDADSEITAASSDGGAETLEHSIGDTWPVGTMPFDEDVAGWSVEHGATGNSILTWKESHGRSGGETSSTGPRSESKSDGSEASPTSGGDDTEADVTTLVP